MDYLLTAAQMRAIERAAIESGIVTGLELMERAGAGVVAAILAEWPRLAEGAHRAVVLCGPGNNGGDGFVLARLLHQRGWDVQVRLLGDPDRLPADARVNWQRWLGLGSVAAGPGQWDREAALYVDALFGIGISRPIAAEAALALEALETAAGHHGGKLVAVDLPSGLCSDSGKALGRACRADLTVTFHRPKPGHLLAQGPALCGRMVCTDIGLPRDMARKVLGRAPDRARGIRADDSMIIGQVDGEDLRPGFSSSRSILDKGFGGEDGHKFDHGHALVLSGPMGHGGAARLAARGALRVGAGLVTIGAPADAMAEHAAQITAIMLRDISGPAALAEALRDRRITALCLGPGLGVARAAALLPVALHAPHDPNIVLDADALTALAGQGDLMAQLSPRCVLTPHAGEFARLFPDIAAKLAEAASSGPAYSKLDATREAAARAGCCVLFKGADTVIASPDGDAAIHAACHDRAAPWLATAGSGDVLAGILTGLLARGLDRRGHYAACSAVWLHAECARSFGPGLIAEDLPEELPKLFRALGL